MSRKIGERRGRWFLEGGGAGDLKRAMGWTVMSRRLSNVDILHAPI